MLSDVYAGYGASIVLKGVSLEVGPGELVALLGRNGAGKTTTLKAIMGLVRVRSGKILWQDRPIHGIEPHKIAQMGIALVPQGRRIFSSLTVLENLRVVHRRSVQSEEGSSSYGLPVWTEERIWELFPHLRERANIGGGKLSGGEQQMLAIARALLTQPQLLLCDEPTEGLAPVMVERVMETLRRLKDMGLSILLVEHNLDVALDLADRIYILDNGEVVYHGSPQDLARDEQAQIQYLGVGA